MENNLLFKVVGYAINKEEFSLSEIYRELKLSAEQQTYIQRLVWDTHREAQSTPHKIIIKVEKLGAHQADWKYMLLPDAIFSYIDHLEIVEARKTARQSKHLAWIAILFSIGIGLLQIFLT